MSEQRRMSIGADQAYIARWPALFKCWSDIADFGPAFKQRYVVVAGVHNIKGKVKTLVCCRFPLYSTGGGRQAATHAAAAPEITPDIQSMLG